MRQFTTSYFLGSQCGNTGFDAVNFHSFARLFRDALELPNALFFDGKVSRLFSRDLGRSDFGFQLGPMVAVVTP